MTLGEGICHVEATADGSCPHRGSVKLEIEKLIIVKFTQLCSKFPPTALLNFACDWLALDRDISFGRLTSPNV